MSKAALPIAGSLVVVVLALGAGYLGGSLASDDAPIDTAGPRAVPTADQDGRIETLERQLDQLRDDVRIATETAEAAMQKARRVDELERRIDALAGGVVLPDQPVSTEPPMIPETLTPEERARIEADRRARMIDQARKFAASTKRLQLPHLLSTLRSTDPEAIGRRRAQAAIEARHAFLELQNFDTSLDASHERQLRDIYVEAMEDSAQRVGAYLTSGVEEADLEAVQRELFESWDRRDEKLRDVLSEDTYDTFVKSQKDWRGLWTQAFEDLAKSD